MNWLFRPSTLVAALVLVAFFVLAVLFWPSETSLTRPVPAGDQEVVWLNPATSGVGWERFVAAVRRLQADRPELGLEVAADANPFPSQTAEVPELAVAVKGAKGRLWFRWYKLTGDLGPAQWVERLARRDPPPLAIIGGGSSDRARELARELSSRLDRFASPPLLLITQATLGQDLMQLYPGRTFRFCYPNRQMAEAVTDFIWSQADLRPDGLPIYCTRWTDDPYSEDLFEEFRAILEPEGPFGQRLQKAQLTKMLGRQWAWLGGWAGAGGVPPGLDLEGLRGADARQDTFWSLRIPYSVGSYFRPNHWEEEAASYLVDRLDAQPGQQRPLLVLPATPQPARRFLRALVRMGSGEDRRFVVATGDGIDFNTIYRDRNFAWSIQDLPMTLVLFCHRNPVDPEAFRPAPPGDTTPPDPNGPTSTGTQDLLLYQDIVETLVKTAYTPEGLRAAGDSLARALGEIGRFDPDGDLRGGPGEFVVCLRPVRQGDRVLPRARLQVWNRTTDPSSVRRWQAVPVAGQTELEVIYSSGIGARAAEAGPDIGEP